MNKIVSRRSCAEKWAHYIRYKYPAIFSKSFFGPFCEIHCGVEFIRCLGPTPNIAVPKKAAMKVQNTGPSSRSFHLLMYSTEHFDKLLLARLLVHSQSSLLASPNIFRKCHIRLRCVHCGHLKSGCSFGVRGGIWRVVSLAALV